jgi:ubiquinone/menaquinone biosynthesis C-methylase UbiE
LDKYLEKIQEAYDLTVEQYRKGIDPLHDVPEKIRNSPFFKSLAADKNLLNSTAPDIQKYLAPVYGMRFLDTGCSANIANYRLDRWPSVYYGVDISPQLIDAMKRFVKEQAISIGGLYVADISRLPFDDNFFDIAAVIGVLEYCKMGYIGAALMELNRVLKPESRVVLDIPNRNHPYAGDMVRLEQHLGRQSFLHSRSRFEKLMVPLFSTERVDDSRLMIKYFVRTLKYKE